MLYIYISNCYILYNNWNKIIVRYDDNQFNHNTYILKFMNALCYSITIDLKCSGYKVVMKDITSEIGELI